MTINLIVACSIYTLGRAIYFDLEAIGMAFSQIALLRVAELPPAYSHCCIWLDADICPMPHDAKEGNLGGSGKAGGGDCLS